MELCCGGGVELCCGGGGEDFLGGSVALRLMATPMIRAKIAVVAPVESARGWREIIIGSSFLSLVLNVLTRIWLESRGPMIEDFRVFSLMMETYMSCRSKSACTKACAAFC